MILAVANRASLKGNSLVERPKTTRSDGKNPPTTNSAAVTHLSLLVAVNADVLRVSRGSAEGGNEATPAYGRKPRATRGRRGWTHVNFN